MQAPQQEGLRLAIAVYGLELVALSLEMRITSAINGSQPLLPADQRLAGHVGWIWGNKV